MRNGLIAAVGIIAASSIVTSAYAAPVADGTVSSVALFPPTINLVTNPATYTAKFGTTFQVAGTGGFTGVTGLTGTLNGTLNFSKTVGTVIDQSVSNFFTFSDAKGGAYNFSMGSVQTNSFVNTAASSSATLFLLGSILDTNLAMSSTPASLTIQYNRTGPSFYSSALTLSVPPAGAVPETATWGMMLIGFGAVGASLRRRRSKTTMAVSFS